MGTQGIGIGVIIALLADIQDRFGYPTWTLGMIAGVSFAAAFTAHLVLAPLADKGWERQLILVGALMTVGALVWMAFADQLWHWVVARAILGAAEGALTGSARRTMLSWGPRRTGQGPQFAAHSAACRVPHRSAPWQSAQRVGAALPFLVPAGVVVLVLPFLRAVHPAEYGIPATRMSRRELARLPGLTSGLIFASSSWLLIGYSTPSGPGT